MSMTNQEPPDLIDRCRRGDQAAFDALYARHAPRVAAFLLRSGFVQADAEDLAQETFLRAYRGLDTYDAARGGFGGWIGAIARNVARRHWARRVTPENFDPDLADDIFASDGDEAPQQAMTAEQYEAVRLCQSALPRELQRLIYLRYVEGRSMRGVSQAMDLPEATVRLRLTGAYGMLRRCLREKGFAV
ncbi:MAG: sigma-70 family RNA polymerase sigma factor [Planctomycetaceae bacterium]|nr:sigma-70 family RNA polymerase sigma factor [Planctomycetaceae bacterium]